MHYLEMSGRPASGSTTYWDVMQLHELPEIWLACMPDTQNAYKTCYILRLLRGRDQQTLIFFGKVELR
jgi:hypothetical protein